LHLFFLICTKKKQTHLSYVRRHKWRQSTTWWPHCDSLSTAVKFLQWKSHTHTSKTRHVKRTQMVATAWFTIRVFVIFSDCKESNAMKPSQESLRVRGLYICAGGLDILKIL